MALSGVVALIFQVGPVWYWRPPGRLSGPLPSCLYRIVQWVKPVLLRWSLQYGRRWLQFPNKRCSIQSYFLDQWYCLLSKRVTAKFYTRLPLQAKIQVSWIIDERVRVFILLSGENEHSAVAEIISNIINLTKCWIHINQTITGWQRTARESVKDGTFLLVCFSVQSSLSPLSLRSLSGPSCMNFVLETSSSSWCCFSCSSSFEIVCGVEFLERPSEIKQFVSTSVCI